MTFSYTLTRRFTVWRKPSNNYTAMLPRAKSGRGIGCGEAKMFHGGDYTRNSKRNHPSSDPDACAPSAAAPLGEHGSADAMAAMAEQSELQFGNAAAWRAPSAADTVVGATRAGAAHADRALHSYRRFGFTGDEGTQIHFCQPLPCAQAAYTAWFAETYIVPLLRARAALAATTTTTAAEDAPVTDAERAAAVDYLLTYGAPSVSNGSSPVATPKAVAAAAEAVAEAEATAGASASGGASSGIVTDAGAAFERAKKRLTHRVFDVATAGVVADLVGGCNIDAVVAEVPELQMLFHPDGLAGHTHGAPAAATSNASDGEVSDAAVAAAAAI
jgi:hypothetical protein